MALKDKTDFGLGYPFELSGSIQPEIDPVAEESMRAGLDAFIQALSNGSEEASHSSGLDAWKAQM